LHEGNRAVRVGDWKLVAAGNNAPWELYDLKTDRAESNNLAAAHPEKVRELDQVWTRMADEFTVLASQDLPPEAPAAKKKRAGGN
jgi:arylsulfatase